ncbi:MAG: hypothetical protein ACKVU0_20635 [Saprospiraceae bacterium]
MEIPNEFFTLQSMLTLSGATAVTYIVSNSLQHAFNFNPKWLALVIAVAITLFGVYQNNGSGSDYFIALINGFLVYATTIGIVTLTNGKTSNAPVARGEGIEAKIPNKRVFFTPWP